MIKKLKKEKRMAAVFLMTAVLFCASVFGSAEVISAEDHEHVWVDDHVVRSDGVLPDCVVRTCSVCGTEQRQWANVTFPASFCGAGIKSLMVGQSPVLAAVYGTHTISVPTEEFRMVYVRDVTDGNQEILMQKALSLVPGKSYTAEEIASMTGFAPGEKVLKDPAADPLAEDGAMYLDYELKNTYYVVYNLNGGTGYSWETGAARNQEVPWGQEVKITEAKPTRTGYVFDGWSLSPDNARGTWDNSPYINFSSLTERGGTVNLYAIWRQGCMMTFSAKGGYAIYFSRKLPEGGYQEYYHSSVKDPTATYFVTKGDKIRIVGPGLDTFQRDGVTAEPRYLLDNNGETLDWRVTLYDYPVGKGTITATAMYDFQQEVHYNRTVQVTGSCSSLF